MVLIQNYITINKSRELVFDFLSSFENIPLWNYYVKEVRLLSSKKYQQIRKNDIQEFVITDEDYPNQITIETSNNSNIRFKRKFTFLEELSGTCYLEDTFEIDLGHPQIVQQLFKNKIRKAVEINLRKLKELLETGVTYLPDGRISKLTKIIR